MQSRRKGRKVFSVESEILICVEGSVLAIKSGTTVTDLIPFRIKAGSAKAH